MGVLFSIVNRLAVDIDVAGHHRLSGTGCDRMPANEGPVQRQRRRYLLRHGFDIVRWDESPAPRRNDFRYPAACERHDGRAARHRFGDHQSIRFVPHRGDERGG
jgi:hypothetical protein